MAAIAPPNGKKNGKQKSKREAAFVAEESFDWFSLLSGAGWGALLGLSAPGIDQWYLAWVGLVPLLLSIASSTSGKQAFLRGLSFGLGYNLVALSWYLGLQPLDWLGYNSWEGWALASLALLVNATHQGLIIGLFALACKMIPMTGTILPRKMQSKWKLPALLTIPLLFVLIVNKIGNAHDALGVPWSMLEYSQWRQSSLIQCASVIGGIGIEFLLVFVNTTLAAFVATLWKKRDFPLLVAQSKEHAFYNLLFTGVTLLAVTALGYFVSPDYKVAAEVPVSVLQGNINIDMQKTAHKYTLDELYSRYATMLAQCSDQIVVLTESALPAYLRGERNLINALCENARGNKIDMVIGALDDDERGRPYNGAFGITSSGTFQSQAYHKRYLVPFGEYTPLLVQYFPEWIKRLTNTPAGGGFESGKQPVILDLSGRRIAPLICFECLSPELVASSVRSGGQLIVNVSDLAWFHRSIIGRQMLAFSVFRAIENGRYFVFAANTGPSAIIDPSGRIKELSQLDRQTVLTGKVGLSSKLTPFTQWFIF
jgi:apolipoprotein N-acyltransferase